MLCQDIKHGRNKMTVAKHEFNFFDINLKNINKETSIILKIMYILNDLPQPDKEYIYELLRH